MGVSAAIGIGKVLFAGATVAGLYALASGATKDEKKSKDLELDPWDPTKGGGGGGGGGGKELLSCEQALGKLPAEMTYAANVLLSAPRTAENVAAMNKLAMSFDAAAAQPGFAPVKDALLVAAQCLRSYATTGKVDEPKGGGPPAGEPPLVDSNGVTSSSSGGPAVKGIASNPAFQWKYKIKSGDNPSAVAARYFGTGSLTRAYELIDYNRERGAATVGDPKNPNSTGYNFKSFVPDQVIFIPKTWNGWIDEQGWERGQATPFPKAKGLAA